MKNNDIWIQLWHLANLIICKEQIQNYILNINAFEVLQNINSAFYDMMEKEKWADANCL